MNVVATVKNACLRFRSLAIALLSLGVLGMLTEPRVYADAVWLLNPVTKTWNDPNNWASGVVPDKNQLVVFNQSNTTDSQINGDRYAKGIRFSGQTNYTITGGAAGGVIYLFGDGIEVLGGIQTFSVEPRPNVNGSVTLRCSESALLRINSDFMTNAGITSTVTFAGAGNFEVSRLVRRNTDGNMGIVKEGTGTLTIRDEYTSQGDPASRGWITGTTTINGGKIRISKEACLGGNPAAWNAAHLTLNGGALNASATFTIDDPNRGLTLDSSGGVFEVDAAQTLTIANPIAGSGALTKVGGGTLTLAGANTYSGTTTVNGGRLLVDGSLSSGGGDVTVNGGVLGGRGSLLRNVILNPGATLAPGANTGTLRTGSVTFAEGSIFAAELGAAGYDQLDVTGTVNLANATLDLSLLFAPVVGDQFLLINNDGTDAVVGAFSGLAEGAPVSLAYAGQSYEFRLTYAGGSDSNDVLLTAVPEPAGLLLALAALLGLVALRRR
jgi:autotransporter-associated beta strand protein